MATSNEPLLTESVPGSSPRKGHSTQHWVLFLLLTLVAAFAIYKYVWQPRQQETKEVAEETKARNNAKPVATVVKIDDGTFLARVEHSRNDAGL